MVMMKTNAEVGLSMRMPYDPENGIISKADFQKKMKKKFEFAAKMKEYEEKARAEVEEKFKEPVKSEQPNAPLTETSTVPTVELTKADLIKLCEEKGLSIDKRWNKEKLQEVLDSNK